MISTLGGWLRERCKAEGLSLRQAAALTGLSHATIDDIIKGGGASAETPSESWPKASVAMVEKCWL